MSRNGPRPYPSANPVAVNGAPLLLTLRAAEFIRRVEHGKSLPVLIRAEDEADTLHDVVVKFGHHMELGGAGLVAEAIASMFGRDLGLSIPTPYLVRISQAFVSSGLQGAVADDFLKAMPVTFGSELMTGSVVVTAAQLIAISPDRAGDLFLFDMVIDNCDRRAKKPNCMVRGSRLIAIDHELTLFFGTIGWRPPWEPEALEIWKTGTPHLLFESVRGRQLDFARIEQALAGITNVRCDQYLAALPPEWMVEYRANANRMVDHIRQLVANRAAAIAEVRRILQ
ncbi:MAG TPA: HipA family kinase [Usitatibacter sp.]|jgi:hypothetical protein|nr:HipA family kinase [Usitatibacter sp.]